MSEMQYRIGTVTFHHEDRPTWASRSSQILEAMAGWGREGWTISRLNMTSRLKLRAQGFCLLLERPLVADSRVSAGKINRLRAFQREPERVLETFEREKRILPVHDAESIGCAPFVSR